MRVRGFRAHDDPIGPTVLTAGLAGVPDCADAVVVVGSGAAGIACALRVSERGGRVVLLESGGDIEAEPTPVGVDADDGCVPRFRTDQGRRRGLGGTAELWHGQCTRLHAEDTGGRGWVGDAWPIDRDELDRYYGQAESWLDLSRLGYDADRWRGHARLSPPLWQPDLLRHDFTEYAPRPLLGREWRDRLVADPLVQAVLGVTVGRVVLDAVGAVEALDLHDDGGGIVRVPATRVVLAAGAIDNARLLQLSDRDGVGLGDGRWHVGRWLQDHPVIRTAEVLPADGSLQDLYTGLHRRGVHLFPKIRLSPDLQRAERLTDATAALIHDVRGPSLEVVRRLRSGRARWSDVRAVVTALRPVLRAAWRRWARGLSSGFAADHVWLDLWLEQPPRPESRVVLGDDLDAHGLPRAKVHWEVGTSERRASRRLTDAVGAELARLRLGTLRLLPAYADDAAWDAAVSDAFHPAGTTRMSHDAGSGVVDPHLAVHGVRGLHVVGSSVFPTSGYANPTLTIVALALRLGDDLAGAVA